MNENLYKRIEKIANDFYDKVVVRASKDGFLAGSLGGSCKCLLKFYQNESERKM